MKRSLMFVGLALFTGAFAVHAKADGVFLNINFNGDTAGSAPATGASSPVTKPDAIGWYDYDANPNNGAYSSPPTAADGTIVVNNAGTMSKAAVMTTNARDNQIGALWMDTGYSVVGNEIKLSFDIDVLSGVKTIGQTATLSTDSSSVNTLFGINTFSSAGTLRFNAVDTSSTGGLFGIRTTNDGGSTFLVTPFFDYTNGQTHNVVLDANYATGLLNVFVDGNSALSNFAFLSAPSPGATLSETFMYLNGDTTLAAQNSVAIDNINGSVVTPLPASVWSVFALIGGLGLVGGMKRLRRQTA